MIKYRVDILAVLTLYQRYDCVGGINFDDAVWILSSNDGWDIARAAKAWRICVYCDLIEFKCSPTKKLPPSLTQ